MEREVYPDSTVRAVLDAGYIPAKVDGNSAEMITFNGEEVMSREWAQSYGVYVSGNFDNRCGRQFIRSKPDL